MNQPIGLPGIKVNVYENPLLEKHYALVLKEDRAIIVGDYYTFAFKTFPFNEALDFCFKIAQERVATNVLRLMAGVNQPNTFDQFRSLGIRCC